MNLLDQIAEARIQEAIDRGELRGLAGEGRPLRLEDARRFLKNYGPPICSGLKSKTVRTAISAVLGPHYLQL